MAPRVAVAVLLLSAGIGVYALTGWGGDGTSLGPGDLGLGNGADEGHDVGTSYGAMGDDTYDTVYDPPESVDATWSPSSVPDDTTPGTASDADVVVPGDDTWADDVEQTFTTYFEGINSGDPQLAWLQLSASRQQQTTLDEFADAVRTSHDSDVIVQDASYDGGRAYVWLEFTSTQDPALGPAPGEGCTRWSLDYVLVEQPDGTFLIDDVAGHGNSTGHTPCQ
jgi:hypothetical protein